MAQTLKATLLVSAGRDTSVRCGQMIVQGPLTGVLQETRTTDVKLLEARTQARVMSQTMGIATITLVDFTLDGVPVKLAPRVITVYGNGKKLIVGTEFVMDAAIAAREADRAAENAPRAQDLKRLFGS